MISMRNKIVSITLLLVVGFTTSISAFAKFSGLPDFTELVDKYSDAVVNISTTQKIKKRAAIPHQFNIPNNPNNPNSPFGDLFRHFFGDDGNGEGNGNEEFSTESLGSGFIIDSDGYVVTNNHVVKDADEIIVTLKDRRELKAKVIGTDERSDLALLKIEAKDLPIVKMGNSTNLKVGEWVMAIGSPYGFDHSVSVGVVSALGRSLPRETYVPFIQTDVAINPGNSGGPLFNLEGEVVGINSQIFSRTGGFMGLSFAIPVDVAQDVIKQLKTSGKASWGWLGVLIQDVKKELAESFDMKKPMGAAILRVYPDTPAAKAGIEVGDVIIQFGDHVIERSSDLPLAVGQSKIGSKVKVHLLREGKEKVVSVQVGELPAEEQLAKADKPQQAAENRLKITVMDLSREQRNRAELNNGVVVQSVEQGPASKAGIRPGDIIVKIQGQEVKNSRGFSKIVADLPSNKWIRIYLLRDNKPRFETLKIVDE